MFTLQKNPVFKTTARIVVPTEEGDVEQTLGVKFRLLPDDATKMEPTEFLREAVVLLDDIVDEAGIPLSDGQPGLIQGFPDQGQQFAHMVAAGQFGHYPAILGVQGDLAVQRVREQPGGGVVDGHSGLVAAGFDTQDSHCCPFRPTLMPAMVRGSTCTLPPQPRIIRGSPDGLLPTCA